MFRTIRVRLMLSYAGIALLVTLSLGAVLLFRLRNYYSGMEIDYLKSNAQAIGGLAAPMLVSDVPGDVRKAQMNNLAFLSQTRVRLFDVNLNPVADSGPMQASRIGIGVVRQERIEGPIEMEGMPRADSIIIIQNNGMDLPGMPGVEVGAASESWFVEGGEFFPTPPAEFQAQAGTGETIVSVAGQSDVQYLNVNVPVTTGVYGLYLSKMPETVEVRSDQQTMMPVSDSAGSLIGYVELSEGPAYGREIVESVASGLAVAGGLAVLLAVIAGWLTSRRLTDPLVNLKAATLQMSGGDLSVRVAEASRKDEYGSLGRSFNLMAGQIEETVQTLRRFLADAAHELHTPLTALHTNLELAQSAEEPQSYLQRAGEQVERLERLTNDLLDLSRIEGGSPEPEPAPLDLAALVARVCEPFASQAEQAEVTFELALPGHPLMVPGQERQLSRAIGNLVENALKFTPAGGWVTVNLRCEEGQAVVRVEDSGIGISPDDLPILFQRFHRGRNAAGYPGSGLGLSIVKAVAERHGGTVSAESSGEGAGFTLRLPVQGE